MSDLEYEKKDSYAVFTLNRPERLNALSMNLWNEIAEALADFNEDPAMRAGIVTGTGRAFCAGQDLKETAERNAKGQPRRFRKLDGLGYSDSPKPFIAAVNGLAIGGGCETALDCDIRICSTLASFALFEPRRGLMAGYAIHHLPRAIGMAAANYLLLTTDQIGPEKAREFGLVSEVVEPERLMPRAEEIALMIAANAPLSIAGTKSIIQAWRKQGMDDSLRIAEWMNRVVFESEDSKEGPQAFVEKRPPVWKGR
jgi:enoyl-CoA hydratase/carnithine racemase